MANGSTPKQVYLHKKSALDNDFCRSETQSGEHHKSSNNIIPSRDHPFPNKKNRLVALAFPSAPSLLASEATMDPCTAFSLACGVIQVIDFSTKVAKTCHELYKNGGSPENNDIEEMAECLTNLCRDLSLTTRDDQDDLLDLGVKCSDTAQELLAELQELKVNGPHRGRQIFSKALRTIRKKSTIDGIQKRLENHRKLLDSKILIDLRFVHGPSLCSTLVSFCRKNIYPLHVS